MFHKAVRAEDSILLNEIKSQNKAVFEALFKEYYFVLVKYAEGFVFNRQICEDIVQNLFIYFWENVRKITIQSSLKAYFYQSVKNRCLNHLRDLEVLDKRKLLFIEAMLTSEDSDVWSDPELISKIKNAINTLPEKMAVVFRLKYVQGLRNKEISESMNISENTVKTQISRAKSKLRKQLFNITSLNFFL